MPLPPLNCDAEASDRQPALRQAPLDLDDLPEVMPIEQAGHLFPWSEKIFRDCIRSGYYLDGAFVADRLVGFSMVMPILDEWHVLNLCVKPDYQRRGVGRFLMDFIIDQAHGAGIGSIWLEVRVSNRPALNLYAKLGFDEVGMRKGYYPAASGREDARVMRLGLTATD